MNKRHDEINSEMEVEGVSFGKKIGFDKPSIVAEVVRSCVLKRGQEMRAGYKTYVLDKLGNALVKIIPDTRAEHIGGVLALTGLLRHEISSYKDFKEKYEEFKKDMQKIKDDYMYSERTFVPKRDKEEKRIMKNGDFLFEIIIIKGGRKWLPEKTDLLPVPITQHKIDRLGKKIGVGFYIENQEGVWDFEINAYWDEMVVLCDEWFAVLNDLISDKLKNYGKGLEI